MQELNTEQDGYKLLLAIQGEFCRAIRTNLAPFGGLELILQEPFGPISDVRYREYIEMMNSSYGHLIRVVNEYCQLGGSLHRKIIDMDLIIQEVLESIKLLAV